MPVLDALRRRLATRIAPTPAELPDPDASRRDFFRRSAAVGVAALGAGLLLPDEAWAGVEARAARLGIVPGTVVDAHGRPTTPTGLEPFVGTIMMFGFDYPPSGWDFCNGATISVTTNPALYALLGTRYGGNGQTTFELPDLRGRVPLCFGQGHGLSPYSLGGQGGREHVPLEAVNLPSHAHFLKTVIPDGSGATDGPEAVAGTTETGPPGFGTSDPAGAGAPLDVRPPFLALNFCIATQGVFPARN